MAAIYFSITPEGLTASLDAANTGLALQLTHVSGHNAAGVEIGRWPLSGGIVEPNSNTLRFSSVMTSTSRKELYGLKLLADSLVFATSVGASPLVVVDANVDFAPAFGLALGQIPVGSITVSTDPNAPLAIILMLQHLGAANPHPQYAMKAAFDGHVIQNGLEHGNILTLLNNLANRFQAMLEFEYAVGCFYWTEREGNPNTWLQAIIGYETFWRPIVGRQLMSVDPAIPRLASVGTSTGSTSVSIGIQHIPSHYHVFPGDDNLSLDPVANPDGGTFGNDGAELDSNQTFPYDAVSLPTPAGGRLLRTRSTGGGQALDVLNPVYLAYCWQRYDPNYLSPLKIIAFSNESPLDVNLLEKFISIYGLPSADERVRFVVDSGIIITASTTDNYAVVTGNWPPFADIEMLIEPTGIVSGRGGKGADGGVQYVYPAYTSHGNDKHGENGGPAILATHPLRVINNGILSGGGAGGGASSTWVATLDGVSYYVGNAAGGGGMPYGLGGAAGIVEAGAGIVEWRSGEAGTSATASSVGVGAGITEIREAELVNVFHTGGNGGYFGSVGAYGTGSAATFGSYAVELYRPEGNSGLAGIAITGPVTVTGNPVLGR